jgi:hypothetical protein
VPPAVWFWAIALVAIVAVTAILAANGVTDLSVVSFARQAGLWFPFSLMVILTTSYLRVHVATGMTRRSFTWAALAAAVIVAEVQAVLMATALVAERAIHDRLGWGWTAEDLAYDATGTSWPAAFGDYTLTYLTGNLSGLLVGIVFYAAGATWGPVAGGWVGTLLLPLTAGPTFVVLGFVALHGGGEGPDRLARTLGLSTAQATTLVTALIVLLAVAFVVLARRTAIARPRS